MKLNFKKVEPIIKLALREDIGTGDITTNSCIPRKGKSTAIITAKQSGVICGLELVEIFFRILRSIVKLTYYKKDGERVKKGQKIVSLRANTRDILTIERTLLNFLQQLSGVASTTDTYVTKISHTKTKILDTRKTLPGLRYLQKYAVYCGGAQNHRMGLYDMVLIKDNHIKAAGSIGKAVALCEGETKIEVECSNLNQVAQALQTKCHFIMLDNMNIAVMQEALQMINKEKIVEVSGGITLNNILEIANIGVDFISIGALTHSYQALDLSMNIVEE